MRQRNEMANFVGQEVKDLGHTHNAWVKFVGLGRVQQLTGLLLLFFFYPRYQWSRGIWKKVRLLENGSGHYSVQSIPKESWRRTPLYRCNKTDNRWNRKELSLSSPVSWATFFPTREKNSVAQELRYYYYYYFYYYYTRICNPCTCSSDTESEAPAVYRWAAL